MIWDAVDIIRFGVTIGSVCLGLIIGYQAYRGFRRHESGPMRYLSIGLILLTAVAYTYAFCLFLLIYLDLVPMALGSPLALVYRTLQFLGLAFITYSLYIRD